MVWCGVVWCGGVVLEQSEHGQAWARTMATREQANGRTNERRPGWRFLLVQQATYCHRAVLAEGPVAACVFGRALTGVGEREMIVRHTAVHLHALPLLVQVLGRWPTKCTSHGNLEHR